MTFTWEESGEVGDKVAPVGIPIRGNCRSKKDKATRRITPPNTRITNNPIAMVFQLKNRFDGGVSLSLCNCDSMAGLPPFAEFSNIRANSAKS